MKPQSTPTRFPTEDGIDTLFSPQYNQTYHSKFGALAETEHIFLHGTGVKSRLQTGSPTAILEVGFGTGLNLWVTAQHAIENQTTLHFISLEQYLLPSTAFTQLNHNQLPEKAVTIRTAFLRWRDQLSEPLSGLYHWQHAPYVQLDLIIGDASQADLSSIACHAIYHDAFSPDANPELWTGDFFSRLYEALLPAGKLTTYSVKGTVRRALQAVGFVVQKKPGPPGKREILVATKSE